MNKKIEIGSSALVETISPTTSKVPPLLYEMIRSFVVLADTLNLSHAVKELGSTRQTVRRHIALLEEVKGGALFEISDRRYGLSALGKRILPEAKDLLAQATAWTTGESRHINGLQYLRHEPADGNYFYQQQHPIDRAFCSSGDVLKKVLQGWSVAGGQLQHEALKEVRTFCNIFRRENGVLIFAEVGKESSFISWFGQDIGESTVGRSISQLPAGDGFGRLVDMAYSEIETSQAIRLDHIHTRLPKAGSDEHVPISYERLMLGGRFPDQSPAIISVVRRTYDIEISGLSDAEIMRMPKDSLM